MLNIENITSLINVINGQMASDKEKACKIILDIKQPIILQQQAHPGQNQTSHCQGDVAILVSDLCLITKTKISVLETWAIITDVAPNIVHHVPLAKISCISTFSAKQGQSLDPKSLYT